MTTEPSSKTCVPCTTDVPALDAAELAELHRQVPGWELVGGHHLKKGFGFGNFREALDFVNRVGDLAEEQGHHLDVASAGVGPRSRSWFQGAKHFNCQSSVQSLRGYERRESRNLRQIDVKKDGVADRRPRLRGNHQEFREAIG